MRPEARTFPEIGNRGIVESDVAVLSDTKQTISIGFSRSGAE
ncbi:hypothetical protein [Paenibacillus sp. UNC451MF]|nr:hypothetical protein [Paenibacillus sp. UNC451MF]